MWSAPLVAVFAVVGALAIFMALTPNDAAAQTEEEVPGAPMNLMVSALSPTSMEVMWDPPAAGDGGAPDGYRIDYSEDGLVWYSLESSYDSTTYTDDDGLSANETRHYRVFAFNSSGSSDVLGPMSATTEQSTVPDAPTELTAAPGDASATPTAEVPQTQIRLNWTAPDNPEGAPVTSYRIQTSKDGRAFSNLETVSAKDAECDTDNTCTYLHEDLLESTARWYRVYAINSVGESDASTSPRTMTAAGVIPDAPPALRAGLNRAGAIWLYWDEPATEPPGAPILGYYIQGDRDGTSSPTASDTPDKDNLFYVSAGTDVVITSSIQKILTSNSGDFWTFRVAAVNRVVNRNLEDGDVIAADLNWVSAAVSFNGAKDTTPNDAADDLVGTPTLKAKRNSNVNGGRTSIILEWSVNGATDGTTSYTLETSTDRIDWEDVPLTTATDDEFTHNDRVAGTTYYYRVFATHARSGLAGVTTPASNTISVTTASAQKPDHPTLNPATASSETVIAMTWIQPDAEAGTEPDPGAAGSEPVGFGRVTGYLVESSPDGTNWTDLVEVGAREDRVYVWDGAKLTTRTIADNDVIDFEHTKLHQNQTVYYRVSTINNAPPSQKLSNPSDATSATTLTSLASDDPGGLIVKARSSSSILLMWNARADDITAAPIVGYKIESSPLNDDGECAEDWSVLVENTMSTTTSYTHMGLMPATGMCYRVFGINVVSTSSSYVGFGDDYVTTHDNDAEATTDEAPPNAAPMAGDAIPAQRVAVGGTVDVDSTITDGDGDTLTWSVDHGDGTYATATVDAMGKVTITGVMATMANMPATITVTAMDADGSGMSAMQDIMVTVTGDPIRPTITSVSTLQNSITVAWDAASIQPNAEVVKVALFDLDADGDIFRLAMGYDGNVASYSPSSAISNSTHTFTNVPDGTYKVGVANFANGVHRTIISGSVTVPAP